MIGATARVLAATVVIAGAASGQTPAPDWPQARSAHVATYHDRLRTVMMLGGVDSASDALWSWDGRQWRVRDRTGPIGRGHFALGYDPVRDRLVLHGGAQYVIRGSGERYGDTWEWDGARWHHIAVQGGPGMRDHHAMVWDAARRQLILFGGGVGTGDQDLRNDTWSWDGRAWRKLAEDGPPARATHRLTYDSEREVVVLFGGWGANGVLNDTWEWDGNAWTLKSSEGPPARFAARTAFDPVRRRVLLFAGRTDSGDVSDLWEWDGREWKLVEVPGPSARNVHELVSDPERQRVVMFGGYHAPMQHDDTWEWDGHVWERRARATPPSRSLLTPGPHGVGYRVIANRDHMRQERPRRDYAGNPVTAESAMPMLISVWYPARSGGRRMRISDYRAIDQTQNTLEPVGAPHGEEAAGGLQGMLGFALGTTFGRQHIEEILQREVFAVQEAQELAGRHPLVLVGLEGGAGGAYGLAEYLASHGYVVAGVSGTASLGSLQATNTMAAIDHQAHRLEVLYDVARRMPFVDATRFALIGKNSDGLAAVLFQMRNMSAEAVITIDGWEAKASGAELRASPFFDPLRLRVPYLTFQQDNAPEQVAPGLAMFNTLRYSERRQYVVRDMDHILLLEYGAALPFSNTDRLLAYDFLHTTVRSFLDGYVRNDSAALAILRQTPVERGYPAWLLEQEQLAPASTAMPIAEELESLAMSGDIARVRALHEIAKRENPGQPLFSAQALRIYAFRFWQRNQRETAIELYELIADAYSSSTYAHNNLGNAYRDVGRTADALASYERALALIDADPEIASNEKAESGNVIRQKIEQLRNR